MHTDAICRCNTILYCDAWKETVAFYRQVLNLPTSHETGWFVEFNVNDHAFVSIVDAARTSMKGIRGNGITLSFKVGDLDKKREAFCKQGLKPSKIGPVWGAQAFTIHDPEGNRIELWSPEPPG